MQYYLRKWNRFTERSIVRLRIKAGCERDIRLVDNRLRVMEKKMWSIFGGLAIISFIVSPMGQKFVKPILTPPIQSSSIETVESLMIELS